MKIFKTKKLILAVITALVLLSTLPFLQSCSNENTDLSINSEAANKTQKVLVSNIPLGVKPIIVKNNEELNILISKLENAISVMPDSIKNKSNKSNNAIIRVYVNVNNQNHFKNKRYKTSPEIILQSDNLTYDVNCRLQFDRVGGDVNASITLDGFHPGVRVTNVTSKTSWTENNLHYDVQYTIEFYIQVGGEYVLYSSTHTAKGSAWQQ